MDWRSTYPQDKQPTLEQMQTFIATPLWLNCRDRIEKSYGCKPAVSFSGCSAQPGWNIKYKKSGKSLCTLYPMKGFFIALVVVGPKEAHQAELLLPTLSAYTRELFATAGGMSGQTWLMMNITTKEILEDAFSLMALRVPVKANAGKG